GESNDEVFSLLKSTDGGANWRRSWTIGGVYFSLNGLIIDSTNHATLYAGIGDLGLMKSIDGGTSWNNTGLENPAVTALAIDQADSSILYVGTFRGLFKSTDSGASWISISNGLTQLTDIGATITALVVAPNHSNILYAGTSGDGVYKSLDGGANWLRFADG